MRRLKKKIYIGLVSSTVLVLAIVRWVNPSVVRVYQSEEKAIPADSAQTQPLPSAGTLAQSGRGGKTQAHPDSFSMSSKLLYLHYKPTRFTDSLGNVIKNRIYSVSSFRKEFPDLQDVQIVSARKWGVSPVKDREEAEQRKNELVYVGSNPFYDIDPRMNRSIAYLVPRASDLLQKISRNFLDSLAVKGIPLHKIIVSSVLRTEEDVHKLRQYNRNASGESCHRFGTTFDIAYNRYVTVQHPDSAERRSVRNDTLKWVLSEVLRDVRREGLCHIKYEVHQACFHITVK